MTNSLTVVVFFQKIYDIIVFIDDSEREIRVMKRIVLIACASYFEGHRQIVKATAETLRGLGGYALDVITSYGNFASGWSEYNEGESSIYELLQSADYDGAIIENNLGSEELMQNIATILNEKQIPFVSINRCSLDCLQFSQENDGLIRKIIEHLIHKHSARKINLVVMDKHQSLGKIAYEIYKTVLEENGIAFEEERIFEQSTSLENGESLYDEFLARGKNDCDAIVLYHDANAIGLINRFQAEGIRVPQDVKIVTLHCSNNSIIYRPNISGIVMDDSVNARNAALAMDCILRGKAIPMQRKECSKIFYGQSCGCHTCDNLVENDAIFQDLAVAKISNAGQIRAMMQHMLTMNGVSTLDELGNSIESMLFPIGCREFCVCINQRDLPYLMGEADSSFNPADSCFDSDMYLLATSGSSTDSNCGDIFSISNVYPYQAEEGDVHIIMPIRHGEKAFGYIVHKNNFFPIDVYNYRICHESIGRSLDTFRQQLLLRNTIDELNRLRMMDYMTETYTKQGIDYFHETYFGRPNCVVAIVDVDGLKRVNDGYGHIQGDAIIKITASALRKFVPEQSVVIRYGGDEFMILSNYLDIDFWDKFNQIVNDEVTMQRQEQKLPFEFRASIGFVIYDEKKYTPEEAIAEADRKMYLDKKLHKGTREDN